MNAIQRLRKIAALPSDIKNDSSTVYSMPIGDAREIVAEVDRLTRELEEVKRIANDHRDGRLAALERLASLESQNQSLMAERNRDVTREQYNQALKRIAELESRAVPDGMTDRIDAAIKRIVDGHAPRRLPADVTDVDLVLAEVQAWINGKWPPFWLVEYPSTTPPAPAEGE